MNEKALKTLEYYKIIEMLENLATSSLGKDLCRHLTPSDDLGEIQRILVLPDIECIMVQNRPCQLHFALVQRRCSSDPANLASERIHQRDKIFLCNMLLENIFPLQLNRHPDNQIKFEHHNKKKEVDSEICHEIAFSLAGITRFDLFGNHDSPRFRTFSRMR